MVELGQQDILLIFVRLLTQYKVAYLLSGSFAVSYYGFPRSTHDIDFVIEVKEEDLQNLIKAIKELGKSYLFNQDEIVQSVKTSSQFNIYHIDTGIKIDFWPIKNNIFEKNKFKKSKEFTFNNQKIKVVSPEDLILTKLLWCKEIKSERHLRDCIGIMKVQGDKLDMNYLIQWANTLKIKDLLKKAVRGDY